MSDRLFVLGGVGSIGSYVILLVLIAFNLYEFMNEPKVYSLDNETSIEVTIETPQEQKQEPKKPDPKPEPKKEEPKKEEPKPEPKKPEPKPEPKKEEPKPEPKKEETKEEVKEVKTVQKSETTTNAKTSSSSDTPKQTTQNIKSLFADISVDKPKEIVKEEQQSAEKASIASRFKSKEMEIAKKTTQPDISKEISKAVSDAAEVTKVSNTMSLNKKSIAGEKDEYYSKITEILVKSWVPTSEDTNQVSKVLVVIDKDGNFDYNIKVPSGSETFNQRLREFLESMKLRKFPPYTKGNKTVIEVYFKTEE